MESASDSEFLKKQIEAEAFRLGFCLFGVTGCDAPANYDIYENWLSRKLNAGMKYLESERHRNLRKDPTLLFPGSKSIIILGWPYQLTNPSPDNFSGLIAGYALQPDYHERLMPLLHHLVKFIEEKMGKEVNAGIFTDSAPILERELGQRAGLGWIGRNSCLISPAAGSAFLLAEIFLSMELPPSQPFKNDRCGTCHRCIDACPTHCIQADRTIDSGKCISYLTIENKGGIPSKLREPIGQWLFGCDECQVVCPWNSHEGSASSSHENTGILELDILIKDLQLSEQEFEGMPPLFSIVR